MLAVPVLLLAAMVAGITPAAAARAKLPASGESYTVTGRLSGVVATSAKNAWAVGYTGASTLQTLIVRWNGTAWTRAASPSPVGGSLLRVAATSARNAWAVGYDGTSEERPLILRWNGTAWKQTPAVSGHGVLYGVATRSASSAWAVGESFGSTAKSLIERWNGSSWKRVPSPTPAGGALLTSVVATSAKNAWAVGFGLTSFKTLVLRWNGRTWKRVSAPSPSAGVELSGVAATSAHSAWAVGTTGDCGCGPGSSVILRWNGKTWRRQSSPNGTGGTLVDGVAAHSARSAWAVGFSGCGCGPGAPPMKTLILRWNGSSWRRVTHPAPVRGTLAGIAVLSASNAWAVGNTGKGNTLILHWNGRAWN
jgi:hypothetical protein